MLTSTGRHANVNTVAMFSRCNVFYVRSLIVPSTAKADGSVIDIAGNNEYWTD